jgi:hypothetical protein
MGSDRHFRRTARFDSSELAKLSREATGSSIDAAVTQAQIEPPEEDPLPPMSRAATLHDPFTTGLLAEVARRSQTIEISPDMVQDATRFDGDAPTERERERTPPRARSRPDR